VSQTRQARSWQETEAFLIPRKTLNPEAVRRKELTRNEEDQVIDGFVRLLHKACLSNIMPMRSCLRDVPTGSPTSSKPYPSQIFYKIPRHRRPSLHAKHR